MILLQANNITKLFGADVILSNIKLEVQTQDRLAIVGRNGAGKSTLLKILAGELSYDEGNVFLAKDATLGYLEQHTGLESEKSILEEMKTVFADLIQQEDELRRLEARMGDPDLISDETAYQQLLTNYDTKQQAFRLNGGYQYEADIRSVLNGLRFGDRDLSTPIGSLSGGQKTRLALGKLLLQKPDVLILDEPTNHLDISTLDWLEGYLSSYQGAVVVVSHDRYFLDKTVNTIIEIAHNHSVRYKGNYSNYLEQKAANFERELKQYEKQQSEIKKMEEFVQKNIARATTTKRAQSRRKQLEKMERIDRPLHDASSAKLTFDIDRRSGNDVLKVKDLAYQYPESTSPVFEHVTFHMNRQDRIALTGPNGTGKTTLLKTIIGKLPAKSGQIEIGTGVSIGYYDQEQTELHSSKSVLAELWDEYPLMDEKNIRTILGNFLFTGDDVLKVVNTLSGGEKARLALAKLMMQKSNLLIMDEPTNHLDLDSKEVLEGALADYPGTILFVSHDRYFMNKVSTQVLEMADKQIISYLGNYDYFIEKKQEKQDIAALEAMAAETKQRTVMPENKSSYHQDKAIKREIRKRERRISELEEKIVELETEIETNETLLTDPEIFQDYQKAQEITEKNEELQATLLEVMEEWEILSEEQESYAQD
ncbi:ABC-F family ATP-binding cassette domain-containing protein [Terribacillus saccharophilus]|uniref:Multidrug ABC transporter ATP-binding protein n=1 Tax=Terribacillus saccharophilus TaxID=361277 RepID=A0A268ABG4_9BACI|nr:ABC-F type ribosomal protection protein [Terribacillus saccharophilus]PAD21467.1 multidrug ABC transporter ATP-binding protein [Terribacillus saccharophilus]PAF16347.1 multidrug ABC transporter ATP-binding protein [Terribacillus saccharophilus]PAF36466.1 multidrug ABC transporter ATP-binding protein [Terribacillus saccharophilus]PAF36475.1 multidrug ABC transporter ATP-binding protein [Terribacillus saccharophilus]